MSFCFIKPYEVTEAMLLSSTATDDDPPAWVAGTYSTGDEVTVGIEIYKAATTTDTHPVDYVPTDPKEVPKWQYMGYVNRMRMFRDGIDSVTTGVGSLRVELRYDDLAEGIALLNCEGTTATVTIEDDTGTEGEVFRREFEIVDYYVDNWFDFWWAPYRVKRNHTAVDLPPYIGAKVVIEIQGATPTSAVSIGCVAAGLVLNHGLTQWGVSVGEINASVFSRNGFGQLKYEPRRKVSTVEYKVSLDTRDFDRVCDDIRGINGPVVAIGTSDGLFSAITIYGILRDPRVVLPNIAFSDLSLEVEGF